MSETSNKLVPAAELDKLGNGSYEQFIALVQEAVQNDAQHLFGSEQTVKVVSTFPNHAVVVSQSGEFKRVTLEQSQQGQIHIVRSESLDVPLVDSANLNEFIENEALAVVDNFLRGTVTEAWSRLANLAPIVHTNVTKDEKKLTESAIASIRAQRPWKRLFEEKKAQINRFVWDRAATPLEGQLTTKFEPLYNGSLQESDPEGYRGLVTSDLKYLGERVSALLNLATVSSKAAAGLVEELKGAGENDLMVVFESFTADLIDDLSRIHNILVEGSQKLKSVSSLGRLYDVTAEQLHRYEAAGLFVEKAARRLLEAKKG